MQVLSHRVGESSHQSGKNTPRIPRRVAELSPWFVLAASAAMLGIAGPVSLRNISIQAEIIVLGEVVDVTSIKKAAPREAGGELRTGGITETTVTLRSLDRIKGLAEAEKFQVRTMPQLEDEPRFELGEQAVLFLTKESGADTYRTVAQAQGKFLVVNGQVVRENQPYEEFEARILEFLETTPE